MNSKVALLKVLHTYYEIEIIFMDLNSEERQYVHHYCSTLGLHSKSYGTSNNNKLIMKRRRQNALYF